MYVITVFDWIIALLFITLVIIWAKSFVRKNGHDILIGRYFIKSIYLKLIGSIAFACYHAYIYQGGDTFGYFMTGQTLTNLFFASPSDYFQMTFGSLANHQDLIGRINWQWTDDVMWRAESNFFSARLAGLLQFFTFKTFLATSMCFSLLSFWGIWKCFKFFNTLFPGQEKIIAISFLYFPTVVFWGSGLGKDSLSLGAICGLTVCAYQIFIYKKKLVKNAFGMMLCLFILFIIKAYIALAFMMPLAISITFLYIGGIKNFLGKIIVVPILLFILVGSALLLNDYIQDNFLQFSIESITDRITIANTTLQQAGSAYDLGIDPVSISGINEMLPFFPKAVVATWYRPWLWEAKNPAMLLSALESAFLILLTFVILIRGYFVKTFFTIFKNPVLFSLFVYAFIFSGLIGLSTGNFGTLVRYKIPMLPFLVMVLLLTNTYLKRKTPTLSNNENIKMKESVL